MGLFQDSVLSQTFILKIGNISVIVMNYEVGVMVAKCRDRLYVRNRFIV